MITQNYQLYDDGGQVFFTAYLLEAVPEVTMSQHRPAIVICPGGGFMNISGREAEPLAMAFAARGFHTFVVHYSTVGRGNPAWPHPMMDLAKTVRTVRERASEWNVDAGQIAILGGSAGGNVCANLAVHWQNPLLTDELGGTAELYRPNAVILAYPLVDFTAQQESLDRDPAADEKDPVYHASMREFNQMMERTILGGDLSPEHRIQCDPVRHITDSIPPVFLWHTSVDEMVYVSNSLSFCQTLHQHQIPFELHIFERGRHGLSLAAKASAGRPEDIVPDDQAWLELALKFLRRHHFDF